jgi:hypothetical protein
MATLVELVIGGSLLKADPALSFRELETRCIYLLPKAHKWLSEILPVTDSNWNIEETPAEQFDTLIYEFCSGVSLPVGKRFKALIHRGGGLWELKTADLRLFGWFIKKDCFVVSDCDTAGRVKQVGLYRGYCDQAEQRRNLLDLDEPKFIAGDNPDDVISDWY